MQWVKGVWFNRCDGDHIIDNARFIKDIGVEQVLTSEMRGRN